LATDYRNKVLYQKTLPINNDRSANLSSALLVGLVGLSKADDQHIILARYAVDYFALETSFVIQ
jgi:hypothetical protein